MSVFFISKLDVKIIVKFLSLPSNLIKPDTLKNPDC